MGGFGQWETFGDTEKHLAQSKDDYVLAFKGKQVAGQQESSMDFLQVRPVAVKVCNLSLLIEQEAKVRSKLHLRRQRETEKKRILKDVSINVPAGSFMAIIGPSGSGKVCSIYIMLIRLRY